MFNMFPVTFKDLIVMLVQMLIDEVRGKKQPWA